MSSTVGSTSGTSAELKYPKKVYERFEELLQEKQFTTHEIAAILNVPINIIKEWAAYSHEYRTHFQSKTAVVPIVAHVINE